MSSTSGSNAGHNAVTRDSFSQQAAKFDDPRLTLSNPQHLDWMVDVIAPSGDDVILDVASGTGHLAFALARKARRVVSLDLTPEMQARAEAKARSEGCSNLTFALGDATAMAFPDAEFDKTTCRFALHHFERPGMVLREMRRVTKPGGTVNVVDIVADDESSTVYNNLERLRDPSHVNALRDREFESVFGDNELAIVSAQRRTVDVDVQRWLDLTNTAPEKRQTIFEMLRADLGGGAPTGFHPTVRDGQMWFRQTWAVFVLVRQGT